MSHHMISRLIATPDWAVRIRSKISMWLPSTLGNLLDA
jgi:hypothetical protein